MYHLNFSIASIVKITHLGNTSVVESALNWELGELRSNISSTFEFVSVRQATFLLTFLNKCGYLGPL